MAEGGEQIMFSYNKILEYPINIKNPNSRLAVIVATQYGGPDGNCLSKFLTSKRHI